MKRRKRLFLLADSICRLKVSYASDYVTQLDLSVGFTYQQGAWYHL